MEDAIHFFFHCIKYIGERQLFNDTVREFQPLTTNLILFGSENWNIEKYKALSRAIHRYIHISMPRNIFDKLFDSFVETNFKMSSLNMYIYTRVLSDLNEKFIPSFKGSIWQSYTLLLYLFCTLFIYLLLFIYIILNLSIFIYLFIYSSIDSYVYVFLY